MKRTMKFKFKRTISLRRLSKTPPSTHVRRVCLQIPVENLTIHLSRWETVNIPTETCIQSRRIITIPKTKGTLGGIP